MTGLYPLFREQQECYHVATFEVDKCNNTQSFTPWESLTKTLDRMFFGVSYGKAGPGRH